MRDPSFPFTVISASISLARIGVATRMTSPFLERRGPWGISFALLILLAFFFLLPSGFQAARLSLHEKENDVKDWLPSDFPETLELKWFGEHFAGESFVLATWPGCTGEDQRLQLLEQKLRHESSRYEPSRGSDPEAEAVYREARELGAELQLLDPGQGHDDWGGRHEKWLVSPDDRWYFITPNGRLFRWDEPLNGPAAAWRAIRRATGGYELKGQFVAAFRVPGDDDETNPFYNDPSLLCAPLFRMVQTGDSVREELAREGGPLWPIDLTDESHRAEVARRRAMERLTGTLYAPAVPNGFDWSAEAFRDQIAASKADELPERFDEFVNFTVEQWIEDRFDGDRQAFLDASTEAQTELWYHIFDEVGVEPPPRQTAVMVTLTRLAQDNLSYAIGRGVLGAPRGRLLVLAEESGLRPAPPPSVAPPPFNRVDPDSLATSDSDRTTSPPLRMGGPPVDNVAIDEEGTVTLVRLVGYSVAIGIVLSFFCFRSVKLTIMVFVVGGSAAMLSMAIVGWTHGRVDAILMSMPSLVYVLGLSGAIHVVNYYRDEVRLRGESGAAGRALRHAVVPCTLASVTTAIGLVSLFTSNLAPISNFGLYAAAGVIATLAILFSYLPAALQVFPPHLAGTGSAGTGSDGTGSDGTADSGGRVDRTAKDESDSAARVSPQREPTGDAQPPVRASVLANYWAAVGGWITRHHGLVTVTCIAALIGIALGIPKIQTTVQLLKLFDSGSRIIRDYTWLEDHFGKLVPMELVIRVPPEMQADESAGEDAIAEGEKLADVDARDEGSSDEGSSGERLTAALSMLERAELASRVRTTVQRTLGEQGKGIVGRAMSTDTFLPPLPEPTNRRTTPTWLTRLRFNRELLASADQLRDNDYLKIEQEGPYRGSELWRISLRVAALSDVDYGLFITTLRDVVEPVLRAYDTREVLLEKLAEIRAENGEGSRGFPSMLVVGGSRPKPLAEAELLRDDGDTIDPAAAFRSTLGELLRGEAIQSPNWIAPTAEEAERLVSDERWERQLQKFDVVMWLGGEEFRAEDFAAAERFIDAGAILNREVTRELSEGGVPEVNGAGPLQAVYTGVVPVVYKAQRTLLISLTESIGLAFVLIAAVMVFLLNPGRFPAGWLKPGNLAIGFSAGAVSMIPNMFPVLLVFGFMGHADILVGIGTMMTASVAIGVAVDDTIHFLSWFRAFLDEGKTRVEAVIETYRRVGPAMTQTTIVGGLGLFVFSLSTFTPTQQFGTLMLILLATALVGDLVLLPAILAGPLGACFRRREKPAPPEFALDLGVVGRDQAGQTREAHADRGDASVADESEGDDSQADDSQADGSFAAGIVPLRPRGERSGKLAESDGDSPEEGASGGDASDDESPVVKLHLPDRRKDPPHRLKR